MLLSFYPITKDMKVRWLVSLSSVITWLPEFPLRRGNFDATAALQLVKREIANRSFKYFQMASYLSYCHHTA